MDIKALSTQGITFVHQHYKPIGGVMLLLGSLFLGLGLGFLHTASAPGFITTGVVILVLDLCLVAYCAYVDGGGADEEIEPISESISTIDKHGSRLREMEDAFRLDNNRLTKLEAEQKATGDEQNAIRKEQNAIRKEQNAIRKEQNAIRDEQNKNWKRYHKMQEDQDKNWERYYKIQKGYDEIAASLNDADQRVSRLEEEQQYNLSNQPD